MSIHHQFMEQALTLAGLAASLGEVPVGAIVVVDGNIVGRGYNRRELLNSPLEHAEIMALAHASKTLSAWRLTEAIVYSTLEPCIMCAGAMLHARVKKLYYGAVDPKFGAIASLYNLASDARLNHQFAIESGLYADESSQLLKSFFRKLRL